MERLRAAPAETARPGGRVVEGVAEAETFGVERVRKWLVLGIGWWRLPAY